MTLPGESREYRAARDELLIAEAALRVETEFSVPGFLRRQAEKQIVTSALRELKRRAEAMEGAGD